MNRSDTFVINRLPIQRSRNPITDPKDYQENCGPVRRTKEITESIGRYTNKRTFMFCAALLFFPYARQPHAPIPGS